MPITTIRMASTLARTGRRMKKSEIMIAGRYLAAPAAGAGGAAMVCICGSTFWPGIARRIPATTTRSPLSIPLSIARRSPTLGPIVTALLHHVVLVDDQEVAPALVAAERC